MGGLVAAALPAAGCPPPHPSSSDGASAAAAVGGGGGQGKTSTEIEGGGTAGPHQSTVREAALLWLDRIVGVTPSKDRG